MDNAVQLLVKLADSDDFFKSNGDRKRILDSMRNTGSLKELVNDMDSQYNLLYSKHEDDARGGYTMFLHSWSKWIYELVNGENGPDPVLQYDIECTSELLNVIHWIGWKVVDERARGKRIEDLEEIVENKIDSFFSIKRPYDLDINVDQAKKVKLRHIKTDRLYTVNRIVGGVMGKIWKLNKGGIQSKKRLKEGKKVLTPKQHQQALTFYQIALAIRNFEQLKEDIPAALNKINNGG